MNSNYKDGNPVRSTGKIWARNKPGDFWQRHIKEASYV